MRPRSAALAALLCACAHGPQPASGGAWLNLESEHFSLRTDLPEAEARPALLELERVRAALLSAAWQDKKPPEGKLQAVLLADSAELSEFAGRGILGYATADVFGERLLAISAEQSPSQLPVLKHELAHQLDQAFLLREPRWLSEGLACYFETLRFDFAASRFVLGEPGRERFRFLELNPLIDYAHVLALGPEELSLTPEQGYAFESAAWLLVHYLANERRAQLDDYLARLVRGEEPGKAFAAAFPGLNEEQLGREVHGYAQHGTFATRTLPLPEYRGQVAVRALRPAEAQATQAELYLESVGRTQAQRGQAAALVKAALALDPADPLALGVSAELTGVRTAEGARAAAKAHPGDWRSFWLLAQASPAQDTAGRRAALEEAARLAPQNAAVLNALAWQHASRGDGQAALPLASRAVALAPGNPGYLDTLAVAQGEAGLCDEAAQSEERALEVLPDRAAAQVGDDLRARLQRLRESCKKPAPRAAETEPRRRDCKGAGPLITAREKRGGAKISVEVTIAQDGKGQPAQLRSGNEKLLGPVRAWLSTCAYDAATRDGQPVESRMVMEFDLEKQ